MSHKLHCLQTDGCPECGRELKFAGTKWDTESEHTNPTMKIYECEKCEKLYLTRAVFPALVSYSKPKEVKDE